MDLICFYLFSRMRRRRLSRRRSSCHWRWRNSFGIAIDKKKITEAAAAAAAAVALDKVFIINTYGVMYLANGLRMR